MKDPIIIKGYPCDKWDEVQSIQHEPFIWIQSVGRWDGERDEVQALLDVLPAWKLDYRMFDDKFVSTNPCHWAYGDPSKGEPKYIDGPRMFEAEVTVFFGNFEEMSHVFRIYTTHTPTIDALSAAIQRNRETYLTA